MPISNSYSSTLRRRAVQRFVKNNQRAPTNAELNQLIFDEETAYSTVDQVGISGFDIKRPKYKGVSSVAIENVSRIAMYDDVLTMSSRLDNLFQILEDSHRGFYGTSKRIGRLLDQTESRLDNLLLLNGSSDAFVAGIEETFDTQIFIDQSGSATVESGFVTLGRTGYTPVDISKLKMQATVGGRANVVGITASSPIDSLKEDDGSMWEYIVYTKEQQGRVTLILSFDFLNPVYVGDLRLTGLPVSVNKKMTASCFYSLDGSTYTAINPVEQVATSEMSFQIGLDGVRKVQITLSKDAADSSTPNKGRYIYVFSLDSLKIYSDSFNSSRRSTLLCGPYDVLDDQGNPIYFTKATLSACTVEPDNTSVSFYLSQDGVNWTGVSHDNDGGNYISFQDGTANQSIDFVDETAAAGSVVGLVPGMEDIDFQTEAVLNSFVMSDFVDLVPLKSFIVKRNIPTAGSLSNLLKVAPGWIFDEINQQYSTTLYVDNPDGRFLDLGDTSATINGSLVSGNVFLPQGYSVFATSDSNWIELGAYASSDALEKADSLYPYNHRYLVEGYSYGESFVGEQIYQGTAAYFGRLMVYRSPEEFAYVEIDDPFYYSMFTIEDADGNWYIKIKVDKTDASWKNEIFSSTWSVQSSLTNQIYVKALLGTSNAGQTPRVDSFKVRVI